MKNRNYPEIRIKDAWLLRENASKHLHELLAKPGETLANDEWMTQKVSEYSKAWQPLEKKILEGMCNMFDLEFSHNIIDVYIAPWFHAFSDPMVIGVIYESDEFVDVLTHELFHRLLTANTSTNIGKNDRKHQWEKLFGRVHSFNTLVHIPVHAGLKAIYLDVLNEPKRLQRDIEQCKQWPGYELAWDYVEKHGYKEVINKIKHSQENEVR